MTSNTIDPEKTCDSIKATSSNSNIEHVHVADDPRRWSSKRKVSSRLVILMLPHLASAHTSAGLMSIAWY